MSFAKTLFAGAALCALCTAPALAAGPPNIHLVGADTSMHVKTGGASQNLSNLTESITFTGNLSRASSQKVPTLLWSETWQDTATCLPPTRERGFFKQRTVAAKIFNGSSTGSTSACPSSTFTFYGPIYNLESDNVQTDSFTGSVVATHYANYNLTLIGHTDLTITK